MAKYTLTWYSLFALEVEVAFVLNARCCHFVLPTNWELAHKIRQRIGSEVTRLSPTVARDGELLAQLMGPSHV